MTPHGASKPNSQINRVCILAEEHPHTRDLSEPAQNMKMNSSKLLQSAIPKFPICKYERESAHSLDCSSITYVRDIFLTKRHLGRLLRALWSIVNTKVRAINLARTGYRVWLSDFSFTKAIHPLLACVCVRTGAYIGISTPLFAWNLVDVLVFFLRIAEFIIHPSLPPSTPRHFEHFSEPPLFSERTPRLTLIVTFTLMVLENRDSLYLELFLALYPDRTSR